jgi:hypothetical protein
MSEIKFACPGCEQHIACDTGYSGMEISCPACKAKMIVPQLPGAPPPPARLSIGSTAPPPLPPPPSAGGRTCQSCGAGVEPDAMICTLCGTNLETGQRIQQKPPTPSKKPGAKRSKARSAAGEDGPWYKTPYPYLGLFVAIVGALYYFGRESPGAMIGFALALLAYILVSHIIVVVVAFKDEGVVSGLLCLCIPLYAAYYVFFRSENQTLQAIYGVSVVIALIFRFLNPKHAR